MTNDQSLKLNRRDLLKWSGAALAGGAALVGASQRAEAQTGSLSCGGGQIIEVFPSSPFILNPFKDALPVPTPLTQVSDGELSTWAVKPMTTGCQDSYGSDHQCLPGQLGLPKPVIYNIKLQVASHSFTSSAVMPLKDVTVNGVKKR